MDCQDEEASDRGVGATAGIENGDGDALLPHDRSSANQVPGSCDREPVAADASQLPIAVQDHEFVANDFSITYAEQHSPDAPDVAAELGPFAGAAALPQSQPQLPSTDRDRLPSNDSAVDRQRDADLDHIAAEVLDAVPAAQTSAPPAANHPDSDSGTVVVLTAASDEALVAAGPVAAPEASASDSATPAHIAAPNTAPHPPPASPSPVAAGFLARFPLDNLRAVRSEHQLLSSRGGTGSPHGSRTRLDAAFRSRSGYIYESKSGPRAASGTLDRRGEVVTKPSSEAPAGDFEDRVELTRVADLDGVSRTVVTRRSQLIFVPMEGEEHEVTDNTACASTDVQQQQHQQQQQQQEGSPLDDADSHAMAYISDEGNAGVDAAPERSTDMEHNPVAQIDLMERIYQDGGINERSSSQRNLKHSAYEDSRIITKELLLDDTNADPVRITRVSFSVHDVSAASTTDRPQSSRTLPPSAHPTLSPVSFSHIPRLVSPRRHMASNEPNTLSIHYSASSAATGRGSVKQSDAKVQTPSRIPVVRDRALAIQTAIAVESARFTSADPNARYVSHESKRQHQNNGIEPHAAVLQAAGQRAVSFDVTKEAAVTRGAAAADRPQRNGHQEGVSADDQAIDDGSNSAPLVLDQPHASHPSEANQGDGGIGDSGEPDPVQSRHEDASGQTAGHEPSPDTTTQQTTGLQNKSPKRKKHIFKRPHLASTAIETPKEIRPGHANLLLTANGLYVRGTEPVKQCLACSMDRLLTLLTGRWSQTQSCKATSPRSRSGQASAAQPR
ncbi:hypothetical protein BC831DRAFT_269514 [Entophlyctis helioformis]|nr:hypothetical protein BC831DRAFT_269514 [Entophlyctis helioformis]